MWNYCSMYIYCISAAIWLLIMITITLSLQSCYLRKWHIMQIFDIIRQISKGGMEGLAFSNKIVAILPFVPIWFWSKLPSGHSLNSYSLPQEYYQQFTIHPTKKNHIFRSITSIIPPPPPPFLINHFLLWTWSA